MSRIGKLPVTVPSGVKVAVNGNQISVEGPKGKLSHVMPYGVSAKLEGEELSFESKGSSRQIRADYGTTRSIVASMVQGVKEGWSKSLELHGVGFTAQLSGNKLTLATGYSHKTEIIIPSGIDCKVEKQAIQLDSADKQLVGQIAASIRKVCKPEPYLGKGIKYSDEHIRRKAGKAGAK